MHVFELHEFADPEQLTANNFKFWASAISVKSELNGRVSGTEFAAGRTTSGATANIQGLTSS